jgi:predicted naringenin-chalcone synthase
MVWEVGNYGFDLYLSPSIPKLLGSFIPAEVEFLMSGEAKPELWAIHPGGRGIIDTLQEVFGLSDAQTQASRTVLRDYGNVSSATLLFVLDEMRQGLKAQHAEQTKGIALAFGPGLTAEMIRIAYLPTAYSPTVRILEQPSGVARV